MPITSMHPQYEKHIGAVEKTRNALEGDVKQYVPKKEAQTDDQWNTFRSRPSFYNIVERTTSALVGALMRKPYTLEGVYGDEDPVVNGADTFDQFIQQSYVELLTGGRLGILVDINDDTQTPYLVEYSSQHIINWCESFIVLQEMYYGHDPEDRFKVLMLVQYRELYLDENGLYAVNVWRETHKNVWEVVETHEPMFRGQRLDYIPFVFINPYDCKPGMYKPPLHTMAEINVEHFILQAQLAHVTWVLSFPLPVIMGDTQEKVDAVGFGSDKFLHLKQGADAKFLEFQGAGSELIEKTIKVKEEQMFNLGSRLLQYKSGVESSDALQIRLGAEGASLTTLAKTMEEGLEKALTIYNSFWGSDEEVELELNKDFSPAVVSPDQIRMYVEMYSKGLITIETLMKRLYEGEIIDDPIAEVAALQGNPVTEVETVEDEMIGTVVDGS